MIADNLSLGNFAAFYIYLGMLAGPMRMLGVTMGMAQRAVASGNRMFEILDRDPTIESPPDAPALPEGGGEVELRGVTLRYDGAAPGPDRRRPPRRGRQDGRPGRSLGLGQDQPGGADRAAV